MKVSLLNKFIFPIIFVLTLVCMQPNLSFAEDYDVADIGEVSDPLEKLNRGIYKFNHMLDVALFKPIAKGYRFIVPNFARKRVHNAVVNLTEPVTVLNSFLQGNAEHGFGTFWRFTINSTFGIAGMFDVAKNVGLDYRKEDFGQTLGVYGAGNGPYIMLPILGPSNGRDTLGLVVDVFTDPFDYILQEEALIIRTGVSGLDTRTETLNLTDQIEKTSLDPYATIRSLYTQKRSDDIRNGRIR